MRQLIIDQTKSWVQKFIVGLDICPFAKKSIAISGLKYRLVEDRKIEDIVATVFREVLVLSSAQQPNHNNTLCIIECCEDWDDFLDIVDIIEQLIAEQRMDNHVQVVGFHPDYVFEDSLNNDPADYTNRSPYPMIHLLSVDEVHNAIKHYPDAENIPSRNIDKLRKLGLERIKVILDEDN